MRNTGPVYAQCIGTNSQTVTRWLTLRASPLIGWLLLLLGAGFCPVLAETPPLQKLARSHFDARQGLLLQSENGTVLAALNANQSFHPASVTKVASTLAFLQEWGPDRRLQTRMRASRPIENGTLAGDLVVRSEGDPYFVFENAFLMLLELHRLGLRQVNGKVRVRGTFFFNWVQDANGNALQRALTGKAGSERWRTLQVHNGAAARVRLADVALKFGTGPGNHNLHGETLVTHHSAPLRRLLKEFNGYSNNIFHIFSRQVGGPRRIQQAARA